MRTTKILAGIGAAATAQWSAARLLATMTQHAAEMESAQVAPRQRAPHHEATVARPAS
jgi:hypothetical protein